MAALPAGVGQGLGAAAPCFSYPKPQLAPTAALQHEARVSTFACRSNCYHFFSFSASCLYTLSLSSYTLPSAPLPLHHVFLFLPLHPSTASFTLP